MTLFAPCHIYLDHSSVLALRLFTALPRNGDSSASYSSHGSDFSSYVF